VERRTVPGESTGSARAELEGMLAELQAADPTLAATVRVVVGREAWRLDQAGAAHTFAALLDDGLRGTPGSTGRPFEAPYWMEAPLWQDAGIPTLVCGPSGGGLHAVDEWVDLRQVRAYPTALVQAFRSFADAV
jgi:acetylornithine deacetylase